MKTEVYTKVNKEKVVLFMHHYLRLIAKYSDLEILEACGRLDTNSFEVFTECCVDSLKCGIMNLSSFLLTKMT